MALNKAVQVRINQTHSRGIVTYVDFVDKLGYERRYNRISDASFQRLVRVLNRDCSVQIDASPETLYKWGTIGIVAYRDYD